MHYHLIGIAGTAMASLAGLLREAGHHVTGSDQDVYPPMSTLLEELDIPCAVGYGPGNLDPVPDVVVVGNAISRGNEELETVLDRGLPYTSAAQVVKEEFLRGKHVVAIAGTHGKTTTTSLVAWILEAAGLSPSFLIGGVSENFGTSFRLTASPLFVVEADEYDTAYFDKGPKMWHYLPKTAVVTNVEFDHADIYRDRVAYDFAFERFINLIPRTGTLVAGWDSPRARELAGDSPAPVESFGLDSAEAPHPCWTARATAHGPDGTTFEMVNRGRVLGTAETTVTGDLNVRNCLAAAAAATAAGAAWEHVARGLATFRSVRRRMEVAGEVRGVTVVDDFAHHPTAVRETVRAARQRFPGRRLVAVFEPRSYTAQRREFQEPFAGALSLADAVVLAGLYRPERYDARTGMDPDAVVASLVSAGVPAVHLPDVERIVEHLARDAQGGDVILIMSNGGFGGIHGKLLAALEGG